MCTRKNIRLNSSVALIKMENPFSEITLRGYYIAIFKDMLTSLIFGQSW